jgi:hypothetical protein
MARTLQVKVHQYDCFDTRHPACPGGDTVFHAECVGAQSSTNEGRLFDTIGNQFARNGDAARRLVVKMDVEGAEWDSFPPVDTQNRLDEVAGLDRKGRAGYCRA